MTFIFAFVACGDDEPKDDLALTITSPNGGENWTVASSHNITWTTSGTVANVKLEYSTNGSTWRVITSSVTNIGTYGWTVPDVPSTACKVRVTDATNSAITDMSNADFTISGTVTDIDGNVYHYITIGTQTWMVENLKTRHYRNGVDIDSVADGTTWSGLTTGAYCNYNNDANNVATYGRLYNWYAVNNSNLIAPAGWHVASNAEWTTLTTYLGGESVAGGKLKEAGTAHWSSPNTGATNETGFTALPGGCRYYYGAFGDVGYNGSWWSSTESNVSDAWYRSMNYSYAYVDRNGFNKRNGFSGRCVRD